MREKILWKEKLQATFVCLSWLCHYFFVASFRTASSICCFVVTLTSLPSVLSYLAGLFITKSISTPFEVCVSSNSRVTMFMFSFYFFLLFSSSFSFFVSFLFFSFCLSLFFAFLASSLLFLASSLLFRSFLPFFLLYRRFYKPYSKFWAK